MSFNEVFANGNFYHKFQLVHDLIAWSRYNTMYKFRYCLEVFIHVDIFPINLKVYLCFSRCLFKYLSYNLSMNSKVV